MGRIIAAELNPRHPTLERPGRPPDVLIIFGADRLDTTTASSGEGPFSHFQLRALLPALRTHLASDHSAGLAAAVGGVRIILVPDDGLPPCTADPWPYLANRQHLQDALHKLSIFPFGFTREMARVLLRFPLFGGMWLDDNSFNNLFEDLLGCTDTSGEPVLGRPQSELEQRHGGRADHRATPPNLYFVRRPSLPLRDRSTLALLHVVAAHALTSLTLKTAPTGYHFREGLKSGSPARSAVAP